MVRAWSISIAWPVWLAIAACTTKPTPSVQPTAEAGTAATQPSTSTSPPPTQNETPAAASDAAPAAADSGTATTPQPSAGSDAAPTAGNSSPREQPPEPDPGVPPEVAAHAGDWPLPNFDYDNTRNSKTRIDSRNIAMLREAWRFRLSKSTTFGYATSNPLMLGTTVYFQDMLSNIYALERATGKIVWKREFDQPSFGPNGVAIGWSKLFATSSDSSIVALDLQSGADVWKFSPELGRSEGMDIQPALYAGQLFVASVPVSQTRGVYEGGAHGVLLAIDAQTGKQRWEFDTIDSRDAPADPTGHGGGGAWYPPLIHPSLGLTYWGTGNPVPWPGTFDKPNGGSRPGPNLYTSSLVALDLRDGTLRWHYQDRPHDIFDWDFQTTPILVRDPMKSGADIVIGAGKTGAVVALDPQTGKLLWRTKVGKHQNDDLTEFPAQSLTIYPGVFGGVMSALAYADGVVYAPSVDLSLNYDGSSLLPGITGGTGNLTAIDVQTGKILWTAPTAGACYGAATIANDLVLTSDERGRVYAFARATGQEVWHYDAAGGINAPLVVAGDELLITTGIDTGAVIALSLSPAGAPTMPPTAGSDGAAGGAAPPGEATFSNVYRDVFQAAGCAGGPACHSSAIAGQLQLTTQAGAYAALVGVEAMGSGGGATSCNTTGLLRVAPFDPANSLLLQKLEAGMPSCGARMPPGGMLEQSRIEQVRRWIENGARND